MTTQLQKVSTPAFVDVLRQRGFSVGEIRKATGHCLSMTKGQLRRHMNHPVIGPICREILVADLKGVLGITDFYEQP